MAQNLMHRQLSSLVIATSLFIVGCTSEKVSSVPSSITSPTEQLTADTSATEDKTGAFVPAEAPTSGTAKLVTKDGQTTLELDDAFKTSEQGPDLVVVLHKSADVVGESEPPTYPLKEGDYAYVADLEAYSGAQTYAVPQEIDISKYQSVAIWCRKFNATFGAATLQ